MKRAYLIGVFINLVHIFFGYILSLSREGMGYWTIFQGIVLLGLILGLRLFFVHSKKYFALLKVHLGLAVMFLINTIGLFFGVYQSFPHFDIPMHFFGGFFVALVMCIFAADIKATVWHRILWVLGLTMIVGVAWEWTEFVASLFVQEEWFLLPAPDVLFDLFLDTIGGLVASLIYFRKEIFR